MVLLFNFQYLNYHYPIEKENITIKINGKITKPIPFDVKNFPAVSIDTTYVLGAYYYKINERFFDKDDIICFRTPLNSGKNILEIDYPIKLSYDADDFISDYSFYYDTSPFTLWKSVGKVNFSAHFDEKLKLKQIEGNPLFTINSNQKSLQLDVTKSNPQIGYITFRDDVSPSMEAFIEYGIIGIPLLFLVVMIGFHLVFLVKKSSHSVFWGGVLSIPILFHFSIFLTWSLFDLILGKNTIHPNSWVFIITFFLLQIVYLIFCLCFRFLFKLYHRRRDNS